ncbi:MAG TPA: hypothetical protein VIS06_13590, partial [Mycobacteriales bacterium]
MTSHARCTRCTRCVRPAGRPTGPLALALLDEAHARLTEAVRMRDPLDRYAAAHLAALRAAA